MESKDRGEMRRTGRAASAPSLSLAGCLHLRQTGEDRGEVGGPGELKVDSGAGQETDQATAGPELVREPSRR